MKPDMVRAWRETAEKYRRKAKALIDHARQIEQLLDADQVLEESSEIETPPLILRIRRDKKITQVEAVKTALKMLGKPASIQAIYNVIKGRGIPAKVGSVANLRSVVSRSDEFEKDSKGKWRITDGEVSEKRIILPKKFSG